MSFERSTRLRAAAKSGRLALVLPVRGVSSPAT